jgi:hypothetical protein
VRLTIGDFFPAWRTKEMQTEWMSGSLIGLIH